MSGLPPMSERRYLVLAEGVLADPHHGKTARGVLAYGRHPVACVLDGTFSEPSFRAVPVVGTLAEALEHRPTVALVGIAPTGGALPAAFRALVVEALRAGLDVEAGMHEFLADDAELAALAGAHGAELRDLRRPPAGLGVPTGANLAHRATVVLTVGSDCAIGKMTMALELDREAARRGVRSVFVPTGQTGIAIAGWGIAVDAVVADFVAGAAERLVVEGAARGDLLWVEGQGSLVHPYYSGVTLGLYHGSAPHWLVLCHKPPLTEIDGLPGHPLPSLAELVELHESVGAVALNTIVLDERAARAAIGDAERETGVVADDPVRFGASRLVDALSAAWASSSDGPAEASRP
jgi:uncharacterized NAD-dependent epimerase/dehydratase family protein